MINLLPPHAKRKLRTEYWIRVVTVLCIVVSVLLAMLALMGAPIYIGIKSDIDRMKTQVQLAAEQEANIETAVKEVQRSNAYASYLLSKPVAKPLRNYVEVVYQQLASTVSIVGVSLSRDETGAVSEIQVTAEAANRQAVLDFLDAVSDHPNFGAVDVPLSSLAQANEIEFSVTIPVLATSTVETKS
jgi:hypothetical protein